jgi:hypothetical protein
LWMAASNAGERLGRNSPCQVPTTFVYCSAKRPLERATFPARKSGPHLTLGMRRSGYSTGGASILPPGTPLRLLWTLQTPRIRNGPEQRSIRPNLRDRNPTWGLPNLEAVGAIVQSVGFFGSHYQRNVFKQSERCVLPDLILGGTFRGRHQTVAFFGRFVVSSMV